MDNIKLDTIILDEIMEYIMDDDVTDINWNGESLWIDNLNLGRYRAQKNLSNSFVENLSTRLSNLVNVNFNKRTPLLEAETENLRISVLHESVARTGRSLSIRKTPPLRRLDRKKIIESGYCPAAICDFMGNAVTAHCNIVIGGLPGVGKTEYLKYLTGFIPGYERVITIEDNLEMHYRTINPEKDCVEIKVGDDFGFENAISASLRHNTKWTLLSEARGKEVFHLMNSLSDGTHCLTTLHVENVRNIPDRLLTMTGNTTDDRFINNIYSFIDIGVIIKSDISAQGKIKRWIDQVGIISREEMDNEIVILYENGETNFDAINKCMSISKKFKAEGIENAFIRKGKMENENIFMEAV